MRRNLFLVGAGLIAFIIAGISMSLIQMTVSALVPGRSPDAPGKLDPPVDQPVSTDQQNSTTTAQNVSPDTDTQQQMPTPTPPPPVDVIQEGADSVQPQPMPQPPPPVRGPGNLNAPQPYYQPSGPSGPGNL
jgi:hypothetical protein